MDATRRDVVKGLGGTALAVGAVPLLLASRASGPATDLRAPGGTGLEPRLADALHHASLAPSGHNAQPWAVQVSGPGRLRLGTARERWLPAVDPENRETLLSLGCFLENFAVAARAHGLDPDVWVAGTSASDPEILEVALREVRPQPFPLERIRRRRTVRGDHLPRELTREDVRTLTAPLPPPVRPTGTNSVPPSMIDGEFGDLKPICPADASRRWTVCLAVPRLAPPAASSSTTCMVPPSFCAGLACRKREISRSVASPSVQSNVPSSGW